jgi:translocator protein
MRRIGVGAADGRRNGCPVTATTPPLALEDTPRERLQSALVLVAFIAISAAVATFGALIGAQHITGWYALAEKAPWSPPNWVFAPVWTFLYVIMSVAAWLVWRERTRRVVTGALVLYVAQLVLNSLWMPAFFALYPTLGETALWIALVVIVLLVATVGAMIHEFWRIHLPAAIALFPYLAWCVYATTLNIAVAVLN